MIGDPKPSGLRVLDSFEYGFELGAGGQRWPIAQRVPRPHVGDLRQGQLSFAEWARRYGA